MSVTGRSSLPPPAPADGALGWSLGATEGDPAPLSMRQPCSEEAPCSSAAVAGEEEGAIDGLAESAVDRLPPGSTAFAAGTARAASAVRGPLFPEMLHSRGSGSLLVLDTPSGLMKSGVSADVWGAATPPSPAGGAGVRATAGAISCDVLPSPDLQEASPQRRGGSSMPVHPAPPPFLLGPTRA